MKTFLLGLLKLYYLKVNYLFRTVESFTYTYYFAILSISLCFYMCWIILYVLPDFYGLEVVSLSEIIEDAFNTDYLDKFTSTTENQKRSVECKSKDSLLNSLITKFLDLFIAHAGNEANSLIEAEELKNTFYMNKKLPEHVIELPSVENKAVLLFIEYLLDATQKLEYANRNNK